MKPENSTLIRMELRTEATKKGLEQVIKGYDDLVIERTRNSARPDILIYELSDDADRDFNHIESLLYSQEVNDIFLTGGTSDREVLLRALRSGATEFLAQPLRETAALPPTKA